MLIVGPFGTPSFLTNACSAVVSTHGTISVHSSGSWAAAFSNDFLICWRRVPENPPEKPSGKYFSCCI
jgi:hypothetical protein